MPPIADATPLRVCLDARLQDGVAGGIQQFVMGLASGLSRLEDGNEEYLFLSDSRDRAWLEPHLAGRCKPLDVASGGTAQRTLQRLVAGALAAVTKTRVGGLLPVRIATSDGTIERSGMDVMHFTLQGGFRTAIPSIYQPYDLQHVHLPQFFSPYARKWRDEFYGALARAARSVVVMSSWVKDDVVANLQIPPEKVRVIPWAPVTEEYPDPTDADLDRARKRFGVTDGFALYPAQTFPHKNHLALVDAVALAAKRGVRIRLLCPGKQNEHYAAIDRRVRSLGLEGLVTFVGYVTPLELRCLYRLTRFVAFPSLFEGGGMPVFEAFSAGVPVACSDVTCLPRQVGDAAILFDPREPGAIADALVRLWSDAELRARLASRGRERVARFTWDRTARTYRALYRQVGGRQLSAEDRELLDAPPDT
jgi:glycosyltransferase involved in cell wall biosynthesis